MLLERSCLGNTAVDLYISYRSAQPCPHVWWCCHWCVMNTNYGTTDSVIDVRLDQWHLYYTTVFINSLNMATKVSCHITTFKVQFTLFCRSKLAPAFIRSTTILVLPRYAASISAESPSCVVTSMTNNDYNCTL